MTARKRSSSKSEANKRGARGADTGNTSLALWCESEDRSAKDTVEVALAFQKFILHHFDFTEYLH